MPGTGRSTPTWPRGTSPRSAGARTSASSRITYGSSSTGSESAGSGTFRSTPRAERPGTMRSRRVSPAPHPGCKPRRSRSPRRPDDSGRPLIDLDLDAVRADGPRFGEVELQAVDPVRERALAAAQDRREDHQPELVDEVVLEQRSHERAAAVDEDRARGLVLELLEPAHDVAGDDSRVVPLRVLERVRDDDLRVRVDLVGELPFARRPGLCEALVRHAAEQRHLGPHQLVELELVALVTAVVLEGPGPVLATLRAARILEHAVDRNELCDGQLAHFAPPSVVGRI